MKTTNKIKAAQSKRVAKKGGNVTDRRLSGLKEAEEKNRLSLEEAKDAFALKAFPLFDNNGRTHGLGDMLLNILKTFGTEPSIAWANAEPFCIDYIECIRKTLTAGAAVYYDTFKYDEKKGVVSSGSTYCICDESKFVNSVVWEVRRYFQNAAIVAKKVESSTFTEWRNGLVIIKKNCFGNSEDRCTDEQASEVVSIIEENCEKLAADVQIWLAEQEGQAEDAKHERSHDFKKRIDEANADIAGRLKQTLDQMTVEAAYTTEEVGAFMRMGAVQVQSLLAEKLMPVLLEATKAIDDGVIDEVEDYDETEPWCVLEDICETWLTRVGQEQFIPTAKEKIEELSRSLSCGKLWYRYDLDKEVRVPGLFLDIWNMIDPENLKRGKRKEAVLRMRWKVGFSYHHDELAADVDVIKDCLFRDDSLAGLFSFREASGGVSEDFIRENNVQVFIFGEKYDATVKAQFDFAFRSGIRCLPFFKKAAVCDPKLSAFQSHLKRNILLGEFDSVETLGSKIHDELIRIVYTDVAESTGEKDGNDPQRLASVDQITSNMLEAWKTKGNIGANGNVPAFNDSYVFGATIDNIDVERIDKFLALDNNRRKKAGEEVISAADFLRQYNFMTEDGRVCDRALLFFGKSVLGDSLPQPRTKGTCPYRGYEVHPSIFIQPGIYISVDNKKYAFTGGDQWEIVNRFLKSIKDGENNDPRQYPVPFTTKDSNKCTGGCEALESDYIERQPAAKKTRNQQYGDKARFKVELLKKKRYQ